MTEQSRASRRRHIEPTITVIYEAPHEDARPTSNRSSSSDSAEENGAWGHPGASSVRNCMADPRKLGPPSVNGATMAVTAKLRPDRGGLKLRLKTLFCKTAGSSSQETASSSSQETAGCASLLDEPAADTFAAVASARRRFFQWSCKERNLICDRAIRGDPQSLAILTDRAGRYAVETLQTEYLSLLGMSPTHAPAAADRSLIRFAYVSPAEYKRMKDMVFEDPFKTWNFSALPSTTLEESYVDLSSDDSGPHDEDDRATGSSARGGRQTATREGNPRRTPRRGSNLSGETLIYTGRR